MKDKERWEIIYDQINGTYVPGVCEGVRDESSMEGALGPLVERAYEARDRLCERLGVEPDGDPDFESLVVGFEALSRACGKLMYDYGLRDGVASAMGLRAVQDGGVQA